MTVIVSLDLETTGLDPVRDAIIEIGAVRFDGRRVVDEWHTLVNPRRAIPPLITRLTGISNDMVRHAPEFQEVKQDLEGFVGDDPILGHNVRFDLGFLQQRGLFSYQDAVDTYALAAVLLPSLVFGFFKDRSGALWAPMALHVFYNSGYFWLFGGG